MLSISRTGVLGPYRKGLACLEMNDYEAALAVWGPLASRGHAQAQFDLGLMYHCGLGVAQDFARSLSWFEKAAAQRLAAAEGFLGTIYKVGRGTPPNAEKARYYYKRAMDHGLAVARDAYLESVTRGLADRRRYAR